jgi:uncharacterized glyoxalase superfamily protein PhnB
MLTNRSIPRCAVIPELAYPNVSEAVDWLCNGFGFTLRVLIGNHRAQLNLGDGAIVVTEQRVEQKVEQKHDSASLDHSVMVRVADANSQHEGARLRGACILRPPTDYPFGERQYTDQDLRRPLLDLLSIDRGRGSGGVGRQVGSAPASTSMRSRCTLPQSA